MKTFTAVALAVLLVFLVAPIASACPMCADAIANANSSANEDDMDHFPAAMNQSIYLMLSVAYTTFGVVGFMIYRGAKRNAEFLDDNSQTS